MTTPSDSDRTIWVTCPKCGFPFYGGPEFRDRTKAFPAPAALTEVRFCCPRCRHGFLIEESATPPPLMPERLPRSLRDLP